ncbi:uncharacterized protein EAE97_009624 [Botrytis byssoidea]|uniref:Uncharacterized protein n=1 Tax=Botrytis byssoidea TaxID=139641 RepID=A0A9P5I156_9HELO|nr:uncharacterized protein EAE97_009624 [Botrytis byssoidea]KAF7928782.1 hypothetical protein EAE97_009624 [Botrytis byssoidea]
MPARKPTSSPNTNNHNPSRTSSQNHNGPYQNDCVKMTETTISEESDIKCTPVSKETKTTSSPARNVSVDKVTSSSITPNSEASHEASRHNGTETETGIGFPRYSPGAVEKPPRFLERNGYGYDLDIDSDFAMNLDMKNNTYVDDDDDDDDAYHYTYKPIPSLPHPSHSPPPSLSSHIPRAPHSLHTSDLISFFPDLENCAEHFNDYFKNIRFFEDPITIRIPRDTEPDRQSHDTSDSEASRRDERLEEEEDDDDDKQNSIPKSGGSKKTDSRIRIHVDESSQQTSSIPHISDLDAEYEQNSRLDLYPESESDTSSSVSSSSASSEDKVDGC